MNGQETMCGYCYTCQQCYSCQAGIADDQPGPVIAFGGQPAGQVGMYGPHRCHPQGPPQPGQYMPRPVFAGEVMEELLRLTREAVHLLRKLVKEGEGDGQG